jgi:two-component system, NtrC family, sensor kinase
MTAGLAAGVTAAVVIACATGAYLYSSHHFNTLLETARTDALAEGELIRVALEHQMIENERGLIARMIESFGRQPRVELVALFDRTGQLRYSSKPPDAKDDLRLASPTCQACHQHPPENRESSRVIETKGGEVLRTMIPILNRQECFRCHGPTQKINGVLLVDYNAGEIRAAINSDLRWMVMGTGAVALLLIGAIAIIIRQFVLRRLQRFETTARLIAAGDLEKRVPAEGSDTIAWLAREFNTMADSVTGLVGEVRNQRERLENVINSIDDGIVVLDPQRKVIAANDSFLRRAAQSRKQVLGCCCRDIELSGCNTEDCPTLGCLKSGEGQVRICERTTPEGAVAWEEIHASPILDQSGRLMHVVEVWRDISDRRAAEAHLAESHRLASLGMLASGYSHELNTPLATVLTCVEGILRAIPANGNGDADWGRIRENATIAREQIMRCRGVTQHFLRMSRGQKSPGGIVGVKTILEGVERLTEPTARAYSVKVEVEHPAEDLLVRADEAELQNVLINLVLNAVQACKSGGKVALRADGGAAVRIRVTDDGCGIAAENLKRIFEPFFGLRDGGTGLGLFLSLNSIRRFGGDIRVESAQGRGSAFEIVLPAFVPVLEVLR